MKILVRGTNWLGDAVMAIPALRSLRRIFPEARISLHMRSWADGVFRDASFIDDLITFDKNRWAAKDVYDNANFLGDEDFDLAILLPNSFESALTSFLARVPRRIGYNKDLRGLLLTDPIPVPEWKNRRHEVYYYLNLIAETERRLLGRDTVMAFPPDISLEVSEERKAAAKNQLANAGVDLGRPIVALGVGSTNSRAKRWPAERYAALSDRLCRELAANVVMVGSPEDRAAAESVLAASSLPGINLAGRTEVADAIAILRVSNLLVSNDMGLAHIAPSVGTPTVVIFGPTNPETTRPFSDIAFIARHPVECSPCMLRDCPIDHRCMTRISPDDIFEMARAALISNENEPVETAGDLS